MSDSSQQLGGRLPLMDPHSLTKEQQAIYDFIGDKMVPWADAAGFIARLKNGSLIGPFNTLLSSPQMSEAFLELQAAESKYTTLDERTRQVVILTVGAVWQCDYERYAHAAVARKAGLSEEVIDALVRGADAAGLTEKERVARDLAREITAKHLIDDALYAKAIALLGAQGIVDVLILAGCYDIVSSLLNTFKVPVPRAT